MRRNRIATTARKSTGGYAPRLGLRHGDGSASDLSDSSSLKEVVEEMKQRQDEMDKKQKEYGEQWKEFREKTESRLEKLEQDSKARNADNAGESSSNSKKRRIDPSNGNDLNGEAQSTAKYILSAMKEFQKSQAEFIQETKTNWDDQKNKIESLQNSLDKLNKPGK